MLEPARAWQPGTIDLTVPGAPTEAELVIPTTVDVLELTIATPGGTVSVTPPLLIQGWDEELQVYRELAQVTNTDPVSGGQVPFDVGPDNPPPSYRLRGSPGIRRLHIQAAALGAALTTFQRGVRERSDV